MQVKVAVDEQPTTDVTAGQTAFQRIAKRARASFVGAAIFVVLVLLIRYLEDQSLMQVRLLSDCSLAVAGGIVAGNLVGTGFGRIGWSSVAGFGIGIFATGFIPQPPFESSPDGVVILVGTVLGFLVGAAWELYNSRQAHTANKPTPPD
jgi:hypothetical protein